MKSLLYVLMLLLMAIAVLSFVSELDIKGGVSKRVYISDAQYMSDCFNIEYDYVFKKLKSIFISGNLREFFRYFYLEYESVAIFQKVIFLGRLFCFNSILLVLSGLVTGKYLKSRYESVFKSIYSLRLASRFIYRLSLILVIILIFQCIFSSVTYLVLFTSFLFVSIGFRVILSR